MILAVKGFPWRHTSFETITIVCRFTLGRGVMVEDNELHERQVPAGCPVRPRRLFRLSGCPLYGRYARPDGRHHKAQSIPEGRRQIEDRQQNYRYGSPF
jgi:hypothetical protein